MAEEKGQTPLVPIVGMVAAPFLFVGIVTLAMGGKELVDQWRLLRHAAHTKGTVVALDRYTKRTYPIVRYRAPDGESRQFKSPLSVGSDFYAVGQEVEVLYDPEDLLRAQIDSPDARIAALMEPVLGAALVGFSLAALAVAFVAQRSLRRKATPGR